MASLIDYMATSRNWIDHEEDVLLTILEEMVADGVRCETGNFKAGTFVTVASKMREQIPGINIEPKHIQNKLKRLKEKYSSAYDMMNTSGFGWDDEKKCVVVDSDEILQEWVKVNFFFLILYQLVVLKVLTLISLGSYCRNIPMHLANQISHSRCIHGVWERPSHGEYG